MINDISILRVGLILSMLTLIFGVSMGVMFGANEDGVKGFIAEEIATHPAVHDEKSQSKIWRYAQRAHFHATGVSAFALVWGTTNVCYRVGLYERGEPGVGLLEREGARPSPTVDRG